MANIHVPIRLEHVTLDSRFPILREAQARAANAARLFASAKALLAKADDEGGRDLTQTEQRQIAAQLDRADRLGDTLD